MRDPVCSQETDPALFDRDVDIGRSTARARQADVAAGTEVDIARVQFAGVDAGEKFFSVALGGSGFALRYAAVVPVGATFSSSAASRTTSRSSVTFQTVMSLARVMGVIFPKLFPQTPSIIDTTGYWKRKVTAT